MFDVGDVIQERQHNGYKRVVTEVVVDEYIITTRAGRRTRVSWKNLWRYRLVRPSHADDGLNDALKLILGGVR